MKLKQILKHHIADATIADAPAAKAYLLPHCLGDGYLLQNNPLYKTIRILTQEIGYTFSTEFNNDYNVLGMSQLDHILKNKKIYYSDNVQILKQLETKFDNQIDWEQIAPNLKPNYIFHESAHAVIRSATESLGAYTSIRQNDQQQILLMLIEESFANTCEFLLIADAQDVVHRLFLECNSYFTVFEDRSILKKLISEVGFDFVFKFMWLSYLYSNFLYESLTETELKNILNLCSANTTTVDTNNVKNNYKVFKSIAKNAIALNPIFRHSTIGLYLHLNGIHKKTDVALNFDFMSMLQSEKLFLKILNKTELLHAR